MLLEPGSRAISSTLVLDDSVLQALKCANNCFLIEQSLSYKRLIRLFLGIHSLKSEEKSLGQDSWRCHFKETQIFGRFQLQRSTYLPGSIFNEPVITLQLKI